MSELAYGYYGIFKAPLALNPRYGNTMYCVTNSNKSDLLCIVLSPDASYDLYNLCRMATYTNIYIVPIAMDILFQSSICNSILTLSRIKPNIKWIYPLILQSSVVEFDNMQINKSDYVFTELNNTSIKFTLSNTADRIFYDINLMMPDKGICFSSYVDAAKAVTLYNNTSIDEIHVSYDSTIYGGLAYKQIVALNKNYKSKFYANSFLTPDDYELCLNSGSIKVGGVKYNYFV